MADLYIDAAALQRLRANLANIRELLERPGRELAAMDSRGVGPENLCSRMGEFGDEWSYGIGQLGKFSESAVTALDQIERVFADVDNKLAQALRPQGGAR